MTVMDGFRDRTETGRRLGEPLKRYKATRSLILGIPRGEVEVAWQAAKQ